MDERLSTSLCFSPIGLREDDRVEVDVFNRPKPFVGDFKGMLDVGNSVWIIFEISGRRMTRLKLADVRSITDAPEAPLEGDA